MEEEKTSPDKFADLCDQPVDPSTTLRLRSGQALDELSPEEVQRLVHELRVRQIELETQNEELCRAQQELEASREKYFDLYDLAPVGYFTVSEQGLILEANLTGATMLGVERSDLVKQPLTHFIASEDQDIYDFHHQHLFETQAPQICEIRMVRKDGSHFHARIDATVVQDSKSDAPLCRVMMSDITERKRVDNLIRTQRDLVLALSAAPKLDEGLRLCVEAALRASGMDCGGVYLVEETSGALDLVFHKGLPPDFIRSASHFDADSANARLVMAGKPVYAEHLALEVPLDETRRREGLRAIAVLPMHHESRVIGCLNVASHTLDEVPVFARDALETIAAQIGSSIARLRAEEALRESEARYRILFEQANDAIHLENGNDEIIDVNRRVCEMMGYSREELLTMKVPDLQAPEVRGQAGSVVKTEMARYGNTPFEALNIHRDGTRIPVEVSVSKVEGIEIDLYISIVRDITERKRAEEEIRQRTAQLEALREVGLELTAQLDVDTLLNSIVSRAIGLLGGIAGSLDLYQPERDVLEAITTVGDAPARVGTIIQRGEGLSGRVWDTDEPLVVDNYQSWEGRLAAYEGLPIAAVMGVPVRWGEEFLGVLIVEADTPRAFSPADVELLDLFATQAAIAIRNARLYEAEQKRRHIAETLRQASTVLSSTLALDEVLGLILQQLRQVIPYDSASVQRLQDRVLSPSTSLRINPSKGKHLKILACLGFKDPDKVVGLVFPLDPKFPNYRVVTTKAPLAVKDVTQDYPHFKDEADSYESGHIRSWLGVPLMVKDQIIGMIALDRAKVCPYTAEESDLAMAFANQAAIAIENARLYKQARQDAETKAALLHEVNHRVKNNLSAIVGLLYAEQRHAELKDQATYQSILRDLGNRIQGLAKVHAMLSAAGWVPLPLDELAGQIIRTALQILPRHKHISVDVSPSSVRVTPKQANDLALIINELATNTVKHALSGRDGGHINVRIALEDKDDTVLLEFRDDGPGYPEEVLALESHNVGLYLLQILVGHGLHGGLTLRNDGGAVTAIRFKKAADGIDSSQ